MSEPRSHRGAVIRPVRAASEAYHRTTPAVSVPTCPSSGWPGDRAQTSLPVRDSTSQNRFGGGRSVISNFTTTGPGDSVTGLDRSPAMLALARSIRPEVGIGGTVAAPIEAHLVVAS